MSDNFLITPDKVDQKLNDLLEKFLDASGDLFRKNQGYMKEFEGGRYSCAYVTLSRRLKQALAVDRELLVVASTFTDQQTRTIKFVQAEIANSSGRLERSVAIVVHLDPNGNIKLRNWGREIGISLLPIDGRADLGEARDIEKQISAQLFSHDPFDVTGPVSGDNQFFGRRDEAIDLARKLQQGQIRSCLGIRKVGKTSIINRVLKEIPLHFDCKTIMIDCSKDDVFEMTAERLLSSISETLQVMQQKSEDYLVLQASENNESLAVARINLENSVLEIESVVLIVFDEIDYITPGSPTVDHWKKDFNRFWRNIRSVYQECDRQGKPFSLLIGGVSTHWFTVDQINGVENAALAFVPEEFLSPMPSGATVAMLRRLGKIAGLHFSDDAAFWISEETGNMPYWARKCCSFIQRQIPVGSRPVTISKEDVAPLVETFVENEGCPIAEVALNHLFRVHPEMKAASISISAGEAGIVPEATRRTLRKYGVINLKDEFSGSMIRKAFSSIVQTGTTSQVYSDVVVSNERNGLEDWAEDLAALGQRRNLIERKLRSIVLNFLRMQALQSKKLDGLAEHILGSLPEHRRKQLIGLPLDALFHKMMWPELTALVKKNWSPLRRFLVIKNYLMRTQF
ncbi:hypothetical protein [Paracoccus sp. PAMC 22219]|uniref:hypothetical protein n=1 Tax=Paracoccus sp. PAMC 22219 TaxID=1569209 RepID=UPI000ACC9CE9|nr:hypothetical protein [Paracoccus sp. PAMC 22219]